MSDGPAVRFRGIEVPVPAEMLKPENRRCGTPVSDAAWAEVDAPQLMCLPVVPHAAHLTTVELRPAAPTPLKPAPRAGTRRQADGRTEIVTLIPRRDAALVVTSPDPERARKLSAGQRIVDRPDGCDIRATEERPTPRTPIPGPLVTAVPQGIAICGYRDGWLTASRTVPTGEIDHVVELLNALPEGLPPRSDRMDCRGVQPVPLQEPHWLIRLEAAERTTHVWVHGGEGCTTNTAVTETARTSSLQEPVITLLVPSAPGPFSF